MESSNMPTTGDADTLIPAWFRLEHSGDAITAYESSDGVEWFKVAAHTVPMCSEVCAGFVACAAKDKAANQFTFDHVSVISE